MFKLCLYCGKEFEDLTSNNNKKYCSLLCTGRQNRLKNKEHRKEQLRIWRLANPESVKISAERGNLKRRRPRLKLSEEEKIQRDTICRKRYYDAHREEILVYLREYHICNKESHASKKKVRWYLRYHSDPQFKLRIRLRGRLKAVMRENSTRGRMVELLGCSIEELKLYLEAKFEPWMNWGNWDKFRPNVKTWHLDHIEALANFDLADPEQLKKACHYTNLQPLLAIDNLKKGRISLLEKSFLN